MQLQEGLLLGFRLDNVIEKDFLVLRSSFQRGRSGY